MNIDARSETPTAVRWAHVLATAFLVITVLVLAVAVRGVAVAARDGDVEVDFHPPIQLPADEVRPGDDPVATVILDEAEATTGKAVALELPDLLFAGLLVSIAALVHRFFRRTDEGTPFARENARDLRHLAVLVAVAWPLRALAEDLAYRFVARDTVLPARLPDATAFGVDDLLTVSLVAAVGLWALSTTFSDGADLVDDVAATI